MINARLYVDPHGAKWTFVRCNACGVVTRYPALGTLDPAPQCPCGSGAVDPAAILAATARYMQVPIRLTGLIRTPRPAVIGRIGPDPTPTLRAFIEVMQSARRLAQAHAFGHELHAALGEATALLDAVDSELLRLDHRDYASTFRTATSLRARLSALRAHCAEAAGSFGPRRRRA